MIAYSPLHGSGRAAFPHPALASGDDAKVAQRIGVTDACGWQPAVEESIHPVPPDLLTTARQGAMPETPDLEPEDEQRRAVHWHAVISEVPIDHRATNRLAAGWDRACVVAARL